MTDARIQLSDLPDDQVDVELDRQLRGLLSRCFTDPGDEVFHERRHFTEEPRHRWLVRQDDELVAHVAVHDKTVQSESGSIHLLGIAEVCVAPECRRRGLVGRMLQRVHAWGLDREFDVAFLFGKVQYYGSSGYRAVPNPLRVTNPNGEVIEKVFPNAMVRPLASKAWPDGLIDLCGPEF
ncbi:MAG: GNAT family N-acetyltransferase [Phycisphaerales bacterium]|nr:GNAT family N-acetyltransferase [Phycisphaerales bacterium]